MYSRQELQAQIDAVWSLPEYKPLVLELDRSFYKVAVTNPTGSISYPGWTFRILDGDDVGAVVKRQTAEMTADIEAAKKQSEGS